MENTQLSQLATGHNWEDKNYILIKNDELQIEYCPTDNMVTDYFTKPLQGKTFFQFRKTIMNLKS